MAKTKEENQEYSRGYAAGRRRGKRDGREVERARIDHAEKWNAAYLAALTGLVATSNTWNTDGDRVKSPAQYADLAKDFADTSVRVMK